MKETVHLFNKDTKKLAMKLVGDFIETLEHAKVTRLDSTRIVIENISDMNYNLVILEKNHVD